jgi:hypothetical protein
MSNQSFHVDKNTKIRKQYKDAHGDEHKLKRDENDKAEKETDEVFRAGQPNLKAAIKEIEKIENEGQKEATKARDEKLNQLDSKKRFHDSYKVELAKNLSEMLSMLDWVRGWTADVVVTNGSGINIKGRPFQTKDGILLVICTPDGRVMHQGMLCTGEPALDYAGLYNIAYQTENQMDKERGLLLDYSNGDASVIVDAHGRPIVGKTAS